MQLHMRTLPRMIVPWKADKARPVEKKEVKQLEWWLSDLDSETEEQRQVSSTQLLRMVAGTTDGAMVTEATKRAKILAARIVPAEETVVDLV